MAKLVIKGDHDTLEEIFLQASALTDTDGPDIIIESATKNLNVQIDWRKDEGNIILKGEESELQKLKEKLQKYFWSIAKETEKPITCLEQAEISKT